MAIMTTEFTPIASLIGGVCVGTSAGLLLLFSVKICGISGIFGQLITWPKGKSDLLWRMCFVLGLIVGGICIHHFYPPARNFNMKVPDLYVALSGLLVGYGTRLGSGCTSGHGICGLSRLSPRSWAATVTFMAVAFITVYFARLYIWS